MAGVESWGLEAHPFITRIAQAKLAWRSDPEAYRQMINRISDRRDLAGDIDHYPALIRACYDDRTLAELDVLRQATALEADGSPAAELSWLTLTAILRRVAQVNTAQWQYVLPRKQKRAAVAVKRAFAECHQMIYEDMTLARFYQGPRSVFIKGDARTCTSAPWKCNLVITSPPYPNNFDYADATRLEMSFGGEVSNWGDLQERVRKYLIRSCSQHVSGDSKLMDEALQLPELAPIRSELAAVCGELAAVRETKGGRKAYHTMVACYFADLALVWRALRGICESPATICFVVGDSAPYGVYVPVMTWLGRLATAVGFESYRFEKTRDRNVKWKNRKHRVPLQEGRLWVEG
jgi:hypothetical protein